MEVTGLKSIRIAFFASVALGVLLVAGLIASQASAEGGSATVSVSSATVELDGDGTVEVKVLGVDDPGLGAWSVDVSYDTAIAAAIACEPQNASICNPAYSPTSVRVTGAVATGLEGDTTIALIKFRCADLGETDLTITINVIADATIGAPKELDTTTQDGAITCVESAPPPATSTPSNPGGGSTPSGSFVMAGATYKGDIAGGGTIEITVNANGSGVSFVKVNNFSTACGLISQISTVDPAVPIHNNHFDHLFLAGEDLVIVGGDFRSNNTIEGTVALQPADPECAQDPRGFVASKVTPQSNVQGTATGPNLPDAGDGSGPGGFSMINWYIAGLIGAGIAWLIAGLSGAGMAFAGRGSRNAPLQSRSAVPARDTSGVPDFVSLRPRRSTPKAAPAAKRAAPAPAPQAETPQAPPQAARRTGPDGMPSFISMRRRHD
jgi:hypothetical protein